MHLHRDSAHLRKNAGRSAHRRRRRMLVVDVILGALLIFTAGHIISQISVQSAFSKSYYYSNDSNNGVGEMTMTVVKAQTPKVLLVNKQNALPADYVPEELVEPDVPFAANTVDERRKMEPQAAQALEELFAAAQQDGVELVGVSAYRSYSTQSSLYYGSISRNGYNHASVYSAQPGKSEHQTGMAIDVSCAEVGYDLYARFAQTEEGIWLAQHCEEYGFIIRYPEDKTDITGYAYEPWHIRYVGTTVAQYLREHDITLDEYCGAMPYASYFGLSDPASSNGSANAVTEEATEDANHTTATTTETPAAPAVTTEAAEPDKAVKSTETTEAAKAAATTQEKTKKKSPDTKKKSNKTAKANAKTKSSEQKAATATSETVATEKKESQQDSSAQQTTQAMDMTPDNGTNAAEEALTE